MRRAEILQTALQCITVDRAATHGEAENSFGLIAAYWSAHLDHDVRPHDVAAMMVLFKLARMRGNPAHIDNAIDAAGYAALAGEIATGAV